MTITPDIPNKSVTLVFEDNEWAVLVESNKRQPNGFKDMIVGWIKNVMNSFIEQDRATILARIATLTPAQIVAVKQILGL